MDIIVGPFVGSIEQEIFTFRPHVIWLYRSLRSHCSKFYIATHEQHQFLYAWDDVIFVPVDSRLSCDDNHRGIMNDLVNNKDYISMVKQLKNSKNNGEIVHCYPRYTKYDNFTIPMAKKFFSRIPLVSEHNNDIVVINRNGNPLVVERIYNKIPNATMVNKCIDAKELLSKVISAKMVICSCGIWTYFCNLHHIPVFSWGEEGLGLYKYGGAYYFNNEKAHIVHSNGKDINKLISGIEYLLSKI